MAADPAEVERATEVARKIKFVPAQKDGRPAPQWATVEYNFKPPSLQ